ncbi:ABC transporter substrate-binding protein [Burkholderia gladioli pv. gladioli]|nr:ABC transporter substrate-binding protein [Burkholderia gladioli]AJW97774.1 NMT1/THI5 like family protein [Burkholderia gladioli]KGC11116.1 NMT1/THI5 like family protein [Burkholderia gladioli]MDJ1164138.1 ABC transporter substrate-binding protein [Burkholderia gladioli pv. gladioli]QPQ84245.1 ABC transporter substrate-binding protein [Burkholderia gladioli]
MSQSINVNQHVEGPDAGRNNPDSRRRSLLAGIGALSVLGVGALSMHVLPRMSNERSAVAGHARITHQLGWLNGVQFGGDFVAIERGYFAHQGLDVQYTAGGPGTDYRMLVASGRSTVSESNPAGMISGYLRKQPLVAFAAVMQRDPSCFVSLGERPVTSLQDMVGKIIGVPNSIRGQVEALLRRAKIAPERVKLVPVGNDPTLLAARQVDAYYGWETTAVPPLRRAHLKPHVLRFSDLGFRGYGQVLMARQDTLDDHHDELVRYTRALVQGWSWMVRHPRETAEMVVRRYAPPGTLLDEQLEEADMMMSYLTTGDAMKHGMLWIDPGVFEDSVALGVEAGSIPAGSRIDISKIVTQSVIRAALDQA